MIKFLMGIFLGFAICTIGVDVILKTIRMYGMIAHHVYETQFLQWHGRVQSEPPPPTILPKEEFHEKTTSI